MKWLKAKIAKVGLLIYTKTSLLAILWTTFMIVLAILYDHYNCVKKLNLLSLELIGGTALGLFTVNIFVVLIVAFFAKNRVKENIEKNNKPLESILILEDAYKRHLYSSKKSYINVLPLYLISIYSLSKIIMYLVYTFRDKSPIYIGLDTIFLWGGLFIASGTLWFILKKYAYKDSRYSIGYTIYVSILTWAILYWNILVPYFVELSMLSKCIASSI